MYWDSFRFVARDLGVRYMMAPSRIDPKLYLGGSFASIRQRDSGERGLHTVGALIGGALIGWTMKRG